MRLLGSDIALFGERKECFCERAPGWKITFSALLRIQSGELPRRTRVGYMKMYQPLGELTALCYVWKVVYVGSIQKASLDILGYIIRGTKGVGAMNQESPLETHKAHHPKPRGRTRIVVSDPPK